MDFQVGKNNLKISENSRHHDKNCMGNPWTSKKKNNQKCQYHQPCIEAMSCCDEVFDSVGLLTFPDDVALVFSKKKFSKCDT